MSVRVGMLVFHAALLASVSAFAQARVEPSLGGFLVSRGEGFTRTTRSVQLGVGDRVAVSQGNRARITYPDGCSVDVVPGAVQIIGVVSPCVAQAGQGGPGTGGLDGGIIAGAAIVGLGAVGIAAIAATGGRDRGVIIIQPPPRSP